MREEIQIDITSTDLSPNSAADATESAGVDSGAVATKEFGREAHFESAEEVEAKVQTVRSQDSAPTAK